MWIEILTEDYGVEALYSLPVNVYERAKTGQWYVHFTAIHVLGTYRTHDGRTPARGFMAL